MRYFIAVVLASGLLFVPAANASSCPGANSCPWSHVDTFGGVGDGEFRGPYGIAADASGNLYVAESDTHRVQKLDSNGGFLARWGGEGQAEGKLSYPWGIAVDAAGGGVYVADDGNSRIEKFDTAGKFISAWGWGVADGGAAYEVCTSGCRAGMAGSGPGQFNDPVGVATDGVNVYVADNDTKRIQKYDLDGSPTGGWTIPNGQSPEGIAIGGGKVYVTTTAGALWRFDTSGVPDNGWDGDGVTGSYGSGPGQLKGPESVTVDGSAVYVADTVNHRISKFDLTGAFKATWGARGSGDGQFEFPYGVLATGGSVWVADSYNHRLQRFDPSGAHQISVGAPPVGPGEFFYPVDVGAAPSGGAYVANGRQIQRLDGAGKTVAMWSTGANGPYSVTPTANGVYAPESGDHVSRYDAAGTLLNQFGSTGSGLGQFSYPAGSTADAAGNLYVADRSNNRVQKFSPAGAPLAAFGAPGSGDGKLDTPRDVALDSAGNVLVADGGNNRIEKFSPAGEFLAKWGSHGSADGQFDNPRGVAVDAEGRVFVSDDRNNRIQEFDAEGHFLAKWGTLGAGPGELARPAGMSLDSSGALWVADEDNHRIVRFCCFGAQAAPAPDATGEASDPGDTPDTTAPSIKLSGRAGQRTRAVKRHGLALRLATSESAAVTLRALVSKRDARRLGLRQQTVGHATAELGAPGSRALRLHLAARVRRALPRLRSVKLVIRATAADAAGNRSTATRTVLVHR